MKPPHPYANAPAERVWRRAVSGKPAAEVDPVADYATPIRPGDKVVSAGSCFAQHISRRLSASGFNYLVTEPAHPILPAAVAEAFHYGLFSARWGNIYTPRQLLQLLRRAFGRWTPGDRVWEQDGRFFDPYRPQIQPGGFASEAEFEHDRRQHLAAVRAAFEQVEVFIFTLGLTECWVSRDDGAAYPVCPGTAAGEFDPDRHAFVNFSVDEIAADMAAFLDELAAVNPGVRTILTVSPVALAATAEDRHVLVSTAYSKAVLRVAAEQLAQRPDVTYFPSYEIVTGPQARGAYFADDARNVTDAGVDAVMALFFRHMTQGGLAVAEPIAPVEDAFLKEQRAAMAALCDEESLDDGTA